MNGGAPSRLRLGVNIDHVATIRNARGGEHPDPVRAAEIVAAVGGNGITAHLREDRRHIRDADMAYEMMELVKLQILNQSGTSMLAQANQLPQSVLSLLG